MRSSLFFDVTQRRLVVIYRRFAKYYGPHLQESSGPSPLKMGPTGCPETSVTKYKSTLRNIPEEQISSVTYCYCQSICIYVALAR
jgi:hypothetical protein